MMGDFMCDDYEKAKANRERVAEEEKEPYHWWECPEAERVAPPSSKFRLARSMKELREKE